MPLYNPTSVLVVPATSTMGASQAANTTNLAVSINATQTNSVFGLDVDISTSGKACGIRVKGTGSADTDENDKHFVLWGNTAASTNKVLSVGNGTSFTERLFIQADGKIFVPAGVSIRNIAGSNGLLTIDDSTGTILQYSTAKITLTATVFQMGTGSNGRVDLTGTFTASNNVIIGATAAGTSAAKVLALHNSATAPSDSADLVHLYAVDLSAGNATLGLFTETAVAVDVLVASTHTLTVKINGTNYKLLLATP